MHLRAPGPAQLIVFTAFPHLSIFISLQYVYFFCFNFHQTPRACYFYDIDYKTSASLSLPAPVPTAPASCPVFSLGLRSGSGGASAEDAGTHNRES